MCADGGRRVSRRLLSLAALGGVGSSFVLALFFWRRAILYACNIKDPESAGNCFAIHWPNLLPVCALFAVSALALAFLILLPSKADE
jgi:hypothetical protein